jgi:hypothetical protein
MSDPRKKETSLAPMLIGTAALGTALVFGAVYFLSGYITRHMTRDVPHLGPQHERPAIQDLFAEGLYPSALPVTVSDAKIAVELPASGDFRVVTGEFETHDEMDKVASYYRKSLGKQAEERPEAAGPDGKGGIRWTLNDPARFIVLKDVFGRPHIRLVWIGEGQP